MDVIYEKIFTTNYNNINGYFKYIFILIYS